MYATWFSITEICRRAVARPNRLVLLLLTYILISSPSFADYRSAKATLRIHATVVDTLSSHQPVAVDAKVEKSDGIIYKLNPTMELSGSEKASIEVKSPADPATKGESDTAQTPAILESLTFVTQ